MEYSPSYYMDPDMYLAPEDDFYKGRTDHLTEPTHFRWHQIIKLVDLSLQLPEPASYRGIAIIGYASDVGVERNQGRAGASMGPNAVRAQSGSFPVHHEDSFEMIDVGNILTKDGNMEESQQMLANSVEWLLSRNWMPVVLGGGHELSYGSHSGLVKYYSGKNTAIVNFDAHFDLRTPDPLTSSGTPFFQILEEYSSKYMVIGIQPQANTQHLFQLAEVKQINYFTVDDVLYGDGDSIHFEVDKFVEEADAVHLSIDVDVFESSIAPGVSAPSPFGFNIPTIWPYMHDVLLSNRLAVVDLVECNPRYDHEGHTSRLVAGLLFRIVQCYF